MQKTVLILGANGRFGRHAKAAFSWADWDVACFDRATDQLPDAAWGADVIVNAWNPAYPDWAMHIPRLTQQVVETAKETGATVILPGNIYPFGRDLPEKLSEETAHEATEGLPLIRKQMEATHRDARVKTIILRAGDFIDTEAGGNWYDRVITSKIGKGKVVYPGNPDIPHAWAYLPDMAAATVALADRAEELDTFTDVLFPGYTLSGRALTDALSDVVGRKLRLTEMRWWPIQLVSPFWKMGRCLTEMRYLWQKPHRIVSRRFDGLLPDFQPTALLDTLENSLQLDVGPDDEMTEVTNFISNPMNAGTLNRKTG